jgi:thiamine biosynthesis protein ThiI
MQISALLGEAILDNYKKKVKMEKPDLVLNVQISDKAAYISTDDVDGIGGLPTDSKKKVVCLISGGFDSPVAAYMMMKRGCEVVFVHFNNKNQMSESVQGKITELVKQLSKFQRKTKLYMIPFEEVQKQIIVNALAEARMLVYRRFMLRIASRIAAMENAEFLVVGDSLSQVASQTIENLAATYPAAEKYVLSPLIGMNKREIIDISRKIGTYDISAQPYGDCCSYFLPKHPVLRSNLEMLEKMESSFDIEALIKDAIKKAQTKEFK